MNVDETNVIARRRSFLVGRTIEEVKGGIDEDGAAWTIIRLDNEREIHVLDTAPWVIVEPVIQ